MTNPIRFELSNVLKAMEPACVGSRVTNREGFITLLTTAVESHDFTTGPAIVLPPEAHTMVLPGDGVKVGDPDCYAVRIWRGEPQLCLLRTRSTATMPKSVTAIVYSRTQYLNDPQVKRDQPELERIGASDCTFVIVAILATVFDGPPAMSAERLVINLAGGNAKYVPGDKDQAALAVMALAAIDDAKLVEKGMNERRVTMCD